MIRVALTAAVILVGVTGCAQQARTRVTPDFSAHATTESVTMYPLELVKPEHVYHDPHEAARVGEALRRGGFTGLRLSAQHVSLNVKPSMDSRSILDAAQAEICRHVRENPAETRFGMFAAYVIEKGDAPKALLIAAATGTGEPAAAVLIDATDPRFAEHPPTNMLESAELLGRVFLEEMKSAERR